MQTVDILKVYLCLYFSMNENTDKIRELFPFFAFLFLKTWLFNVENDSMFLCNL